MIAITARVELAPASVEDYVEAAKTLVEPTREEKGCQLYAMARDICDPSVIWISEQWEAQADLDAHLRSPHIKRFLEQTGVMEVVSLDARQYEVTSVGPVKMPED